MMDEKNFISIFEFLSGFLYGVFYLTLCVASTNLAKFKRYGEPALRNRNPDPSPLPARLFSALQGTRIGTPIQ